MSDSVEMKSSQSDIKIIELTLQDIPQIAHIHRQAFPDSLMTKLGDQVVKKYYQWHFDDSHVITKVVGAIADGRCIGFILTGVFNGSTSGFVRKNRVLIIKEATLRPWLLLDKELSKKYRRGLNLLKSAFVKKPNSNVKKDIIQKKVPEKSYGLVSLAVLPEYRRIGAGKLLMRELEKIAEKFGYSYTDFTVEPTNYKAVSLYEKLGWQKVLSNGEWKGVMKKKIENLSSQK